MTGKFARISIQLTIFVSSLTLFTSPFEGYITYFAMLLFFPIYILRFGIPSKPVLLFLPLLLSGLIYTQTGDNEMGMLMKILIGLFSSVLFYRYVMEAFKFDVNDLFNLYIKGAYVVSLIGLIQMASFFVGFSPGYDYSWLLNKWAVNPGGIGIRLNSVFSEPAYFAGVVGPAFFVAVNNLFSKKRQFMSRNQGYIIIVAYLLTFSSLGIMSIFVTMVLLLVNYGFFRYALIVTPVLIIGYYQAYNGIEEFRTRVDGTATAFGTEDIEVRDFNRIHGSSFVLYNNYVIATENFIRNPLFGTGLGSHPIAFDKYSLTNMRGIVKINFNKADANSMGLRLLSETGLYGFGLMIFIIVRNYVSRKRSKDDTNWLMSNAILVVVLVYLARQGHYFINGFPFFLWLYYYIRIDNQKPLNEPSEHQENGSAPSPQPALTP